MGFYDYLKTKDIFKDGTIARKFNNIMKDILTNNIGKNDCTDEEIIIINKTENNSIEIIRKKCLIYMI